MLSVFSISELVNEIILHLSVGDAAITMARLRCTHGVLATMFKMNIEQRDKIYPGEIIPAFILRVGPLSIKEIRSRKMTWHGSIRFGDIKYRKCDDVCTTLIYRNNDCVSYDINLWEMVNIIKLYNMNTVVGTAVEKDRRNYVRIPLAIGHNATPYRCGVEVDNVLYYLEKPSYHANGTYYKIHNYIYWSHVDFGNFSNVRRMSRVNFYVAASFSTAHT